MDDDDSSERAPDDMTNAIALSIADSNETWETYHTQQGRVRWEADYFLERLQERGYTVVAQPKEG